MVSSAGGFEDAGSVSSVCTHHRIQAFYSLNSVDLQTESSESPSCGGGADPCVSFTSSVSLWESLLDTEEKWFKASRSSRQLRSHRLNLFISHTDTDTHQAGKPHGKLVYWLLFYSKWMWVSVFACYSAEVSPRFHFIPLSEQGDDRPVPSRLPPAVHYTTRCCLNKSSSEKYLLNLDLLNSGSNLQQGRKISRSTVHDLQSQWYTGGFTGWGVFVSLQVWWKPSTRPWIWSSHTSAPVETQMWR